MDESGLDSSFNDEDALLPEPLQRESNELRRDQINGADWTDEKQSRFLELTSMENEAKDTRGIN